MKTEQNAKTCFGDFVNILNPEFSTANLKPERPIFAENTIHTVNEYFGW